MVSRLFKLRRPAPLSIELLDPLFLVLSCSPMFSNSGFLQANADPLIPILDLPVGPILLPFFSFISPPYPSSGFELSRWEGWPCMSCSIPLPTCGKQQDPSPKWTPPPLPRRRFSPLLLWLPGCCDSVAVCNRLSLRSLSSIVAVPQKSSSFLLPRSMTPLFPGETSAKQRPTRDFLGQTPRRPQTVYNLHSLTCKLTSSSFPRPPFVFS